MISDKVHYNLISSLPGLDCAGIVRQCVADDGDTIQVNSLDNKLDGAMTMHFRRS